MWLTESWPNFGSAEPRQTADGHDVGPYAGDVRPLVPYRLELGFPKSVERRDAASQRPMKCDEERSALLIVEIDKAATTTGTPAARNGLAMLIAPSPRRIWPPLVRQPANTTIRVRGSR